VVEEKKINGSTARNGPGPPHYRGFTITLRHITLGTIPLAELSARRRDLHLTTHNTHKRQASIPLARFEPTIPASEWSQTYALDRAVTGIGMNNTRLHNSFFLFIIFRPALGFLRCKNLSLLHPDWLEEILSFLSVDNIPFSLSVVDKSTLVPIACSGTFRSYLAVFRAATGIIEFRCIPPYNTGIYHFLHFIFILILGINLICVMYKLFS